MESGKKIYLMRGLPSSGKSHTALDLAGDSGVICETDAYFYSQIGDDPQRYDYQAELLEAAREWNLARFKAAVQEGISPVIVDRGNGLSRSTQVYAEYGVANGYEVQLREPDSEWWQEIRILLKYRKYTRPLLRQWAEVLAAMSKNTHRVPVAVIWRRMESWQFNLKVADILNYTPDKGNTVSDSRTNRISNPLGETENTGSQNLDTSGRWIGDFLLDVTEGMRYPNPNDGIVIAMPSGDDDEVVAGSDSPLEAISDYGL